MDTKVTLRHTMNGIRKRMVDEERTQASDEITQTILSLSVWMRAKTVNIYISLPTEVDTTRLVKEAKNAGKTVTTPRDERASDLYIVPGVAFDYDGNRLGRGGGFYDRLLKDRRTITIGLAFEKQMVAHVPHFSYDVPMTIVVTERSVYGKA